MAWYDTLQTRAKADPVLRPDAEAYWQLVVQLPPEKLEPIVLIVNEYKRRNGASQEYLRSMPGNKGLNFLLDQAPEELKQLVLAYLKQVVV